MRHLVFLFLLSTSLTIGFTSSAHAKPVKVTNHKEISTPIVDWIKEQIGLDGKAAEENTLAIVHQTKQQGDQKDAGELNATKRAWENADVKVHSKTMNLDAYACSYATSTDGVSKAAETASQVTKQKLAERLAILSGQPGTPTANGEVQFKNELYDTMQLLGDDRFSVGYLFNTDNLNSIGPEVNNLDYLQNLLYARIPLYLNKDLADNPDTETKNTLATADRLRSEMAIGQSVFSIMQGNRAVTEGITAPKFLRQILEANKYSDEYLDELLPPNASLHAQLKALSVGQFGSAYSGEKLVDNPEILNAGILFNSMLTNLLLFKQYELLETIALSTSTQVIATREEAIKDVSARISRKNSR